MMRNAYRTIYFTLLILFIVLGSLTFTSCGSKGAPMNQPEPAISPNIESLLASPDSYMGKWVEVYGDVYRIEIAGSGVVGKSITVHISPPNETSVELLKCEFDRNSPPPPTLKEGQLVTILGRIDIIEAVVWLRECSVVNYGK